MVIWLDDETLMYLKFVFSSQWFSEKCEHFQEFMELLEVVYPSHKAISADNVEYLLDLGDKFQIQVS